MKNVLVTGTAGFIGFHLSNRLLKDGYNVIGLDNLNDYYDVKLKTDRLAILKNQDGFKFYKGDLMNNDFLKSIFTEHKINIVINLAAQAGVRHSIENPSVYINSNIVGFSNIIECAKNNEVENFIFASSSSVYGANRKMPLSVSDNVDHPMSLYAASKKSNELIAHSYSSLFNMPVIGLRFFTAYGPWGRPDMSLFLFTKAMLKGEPIQVFNNGNMKRDFTFIDDIVSSIANLVKTPAKKDLSWSGEKPDPSRSYAPYKIYNIGNNKSVSLMDYIKTIEKHLGIEAKKEFLPMQPGDVPETFADVNALIEDISYKPNTELDYGVEKFVEWYKSYYKIDP